ncbi:MAG TPA: hypothetical protein PK264_18955 [Hyphomicrobiaceae bacterium]|nr:hypothetical protein [Hyphomicrobiaceae bacterium]
MAHGLTRNGPPRIEPRGLSCAEAAAYLGIRATLFKQLVFEGRLPAAVKLAGRRVWDRHALDKAFDRLGQEPAARPACDASQVPSPTGDIWDNPRV